MFIFIKSLGMQLDDIILPYVQSYGGFPKFPDSPQKSHP